METKDIVIGLVIGVLIGAGGIFLVDQSRLSNLNKQAKALETQVDQLNEVISAKDEIITAQEEAVIMNEALQEELNASRSLISRASALIVQLSEDYNKTNYLCAHQTYKAEEALTLLNQYLPEYEPGCEFSFVYGLLSFEDWWEINKGPLEEWWRLVYP